MSEPVEPIELLPQEVTFLDLFAGDSLPFTLTFPWDASSSIHKLLIGDSPITVSDVLSDGNGLTVGSYSGGETVVAVLIDGTILAEAQTYYWTYKIDNVTQFWGTIPTKAGQVEP